MALENKIEDRTATVCIIGLGYVGLPFAVEFAKTGFPVIGLDVDEAKVSAIKRSESTIADVPSEELVPLVREGRLRATTDYDALRDADVIFICVPTPFDAMKAPDLSFVASAAEGIASRLRPGQLIIMQSTTYPGTTEEVVLPILERSGLKPGADFFLAFSPERINPGDREHTIRNTPKVVGGMTPHCAQLARHLLTQLNPHVHVVSSPRVAEMTKLLENIYRSVNIALVNELAMLCERMGIDIWEVIEAASTKPFGFMPFYPGAGVGGHCIPVDPYYLSWKAREYDFYTKFIELAAEVNQAMPYRLVSRVSEALNRQDKTIRGARVLILGVAFKPDIEDARNSPAQRVIELLLERGAVVQYNDPYVPRFHVGNDVFHHGDVTLESVELEAGILATSDCVVITTGHSCYDYDWIVSQSSLVVDAVNATRQARDGRDKVVRIGAPLAKLDT